MLTVGCQSFAQYIRMLCTGRFILVESVAMRLLNNRIKTSIDLNGTNNLHRPSKTKVPEDGRFNDS